MSTSPKDVEVLHESHADHDPKGEIEESQEYHSATLRVNTEHNTSPERKIYTYDSEELFPRGYPLVQAEHRHGLGKAISKYITAGTRPVAVQPHAQPHYDENDDNEDVVQEDQKIQDAEKAAFDEDKD